MSYTTRRRQRRCINGGRRGRWEGALNVVARSSASTSRLTPKQCNQDNSGNRDGRGHRQQSTKIGSKDMVAVATAMETAAAGTATTAMGAPRTALGIGADEIPFATA